jgi:hypothetical protein
MSWQKEKRWRRFCGNDRFCDEGHRKTLDDNHKFEISDYARGWFPAAVAESGR